MPDGSRLPEKGTLFQTPAELEAMLERAAHRGARRALESVGLHDDKAGDDVRDLRGLIRDWRTMRTGFLRGLGKILLWAILIAVGAFSIKSGMLEWKG